MAGNLLGDNSSLPDFAIGFASGAAIGLEFLVITYMFRYQRALRNEDKLKTLYIKENDEREKYIQSQIGQLGLNLIYGGIALATIIAGFIDYTVFLTTLSILVYAVIVRGTLKLYYHHKS